MAAQGLAGKARMTGFFVWVVAMLPGFCVATNALSESRLEIGLVVEAARSVVRIEAERPGFGMQLGAGIVLADGEVTTACHVIRDARTVFVIYAGRRRAISNLRVMATRDVCAFSVVGLEAPAAKKCALPGNCRLVNWSPHWDLAVVPE